MERRREIERRSEWGEREKGREIAGERKSERENVCVFVCVCVCV